MSQPINRYKADLREFKFILFEQLKLGELLGKAPYADWGEEEIGMVIDQAYRFSTEVTGPLNAVGDKGCRLEKGQVYTPPGFKEAWKGLYEQGFKTLTVEPEYGGQWRCGEVSYQSKWLEQSVWDDYIIVERTALHHVHIVHVGKPRHIQSELATLLESFQHPVWRWKQCFQRAGEIRTTADDWLIWHHELES